jgi:hypothetical protein
MLVDESIFSMQKIIQLTDKKKNCSSGQDAVILILKFAAICQSPRMPPASSGEESKRKSH